MRHTLPTSAAMAALLALAGSGTAAAGGRISVWVLDRDGGPVPEVVVSARSLDGVAAGKAQLSPARMNQHGLAFEPHILVVETGTSVVFPNDDDVRHHVYSFSPAKQFNFSIDSHESREDLRFDTPGIVTLGCNIHDEMLAYIVVVATPHFAMTGPDGGIELSGLAPGRYEVSIWTSRIAQKHQPSPIEVDVADGATAAVEHRFDEKLYPPHRHSETSLHWSHY